MKVVLDKFRSLLARFIGHHLHRPLPLVIGAWLWLAAETEDLDEKGRCLEAVLQSFAAESQHTRKGGQVHSWSPLRLL